MSQELPRRLLRSTAALALGLLLLANALATGWAVEEEGSTGASPAISGLRGHFSVSYYFSGSGGANVAFVGDESPPGGVSVAGAVSFAVAGFETEVSADRLDPSRQSLALSVANDSYRGSLALVNTPASPDRDASLDLRLRNSLRIDGLPAVTLSFVHRNGPGGSSSDSLDIGLSDSYRQLAPGVPALRWQLGYRLGASRGAGRAVSLRQGARLRLTGEIRDEAPGALRFRPGIGVQLDWDRRDDTSFRHRYQLSLSAESEGADERLDLAFDLDFDDEAQPASEHSIGYRTSLFGPLAVVGEVSLESGAGESQAHYRLGLAADLGARFTVQAGYHGRSGSEAGSNGVEASLGYRLNSRPWYLTARADGDLQFVVGGGLEPSTRASLNLRYGGELLSASATGHLRFDGERFTGRAAMSADYTRDGTSVSLSGGLQLSRDVSADADLTARTRLAGDWSIQGSVGYRVKLAQETDRLVTVGLGLRYDFGGTR